jgi:hypothetical protein
MQPAKSMILHLQQPITYQKAPFSTTDAEQAYQQMLIFLDARQVGSEGCIALSSTRNLLFCGIQDPPDEDTRYAVQHGLIQPLPDGVYHIEPGRYEFIQLAPTKDLQTLLDHIPMLFDGPNCIYVRLLKENAISIVAQLWVVR